MSQQPGPTFTGRASVVSLGVELGEFKLVARSRRLLESGRILWRLRDYFWAKLEVACKDVKIAHQMKARWRDSCDEADDEV